MSTTKRVLHKCPLGTGGITNIVLNLCSHMNRDIVNFDYLTFRNQEEFAEKKAEALGGRKYVVDNSKEKNKFMKFWVKFIGIYKCCKNNNFDSFHINASTPYDTLFAIPARAGGVKKIIVHSHNTNKVGKSKAYYAMTRFIKRIMPIYTDVYLACSTEAAIFMFPEKIIREKKYIIVNNGIQTDKFIFNESIRNRVREENGWNDKIVIGNIGRFHEQKNHDFILEIFSELIKFNSNYRLLLIGNGDREKHILNLINEKGLADYITIVPSTSKVADYMFAMDIFLFPSLYEGLPVVGVEAQAAGLKVFASNTITKEVKITDLWNIEALDTPADEWARIINDSIHYERIDRSEEIKEHGFDINDVAAKMQEIYSE